MRNTKRPCATLTAVRRPITSSARAPAAGALDRPRACDQDVRLQPPRLRSHLPDRSRRRGREPGARRRHSLDRVSSVTGRRGGGARAAGRLGLPVGEQRPEAVTELEPLPRCSGTRAPSSCSLATRATPGDLRLRTGNCAEIAAVHAIAVPPTSLEASASAPGDRWPLPGALCLSGVSFLHSLHSGCRPQQIAVSEPHATLRVVPTMPDRPPSLSSARHHRPSLRARVARRRRGHCRRPHPGARRRTLLGGAETRELAQACGALMRLRETRFAETPVLLAIGRRPQHLTAAALVIASGTRPLAVPSSHRHGRLTASSPHRHLPPRRERLLVGAPADRRRRTARCGRERAARAGAERPPWSARPAARTPRDDAVHVREHDRVVSVAHPSCALPRSPPRDSGCDASCWPTWPRCATLTRRLDAQRTSTPSRYRPRHVEQARVAAPSAAAIRH